MLLPEAKLVIENEPIYQYVEVDSDTDYQSEQSDEEQSEQGDEEDSGSDQSEGEEDNEGFESASEDSDSDSEDGSTQSNPQRANRTQVTTNVCQTEGVVLPDDSDVESDGDCSDPLPFRSLNCQVPSKAVKCLILVRSRRKRKLSNFRVQSKWSCWWRIVSMPIRQYRLPLLRLLALHPPRRL